MDVLLCIRHTVSHNKSILSMSDKPLHWVQQLQISALFIGHHQGVFRLIEKLYNKQGILGGLGCCGGTRSRLCDRGWHNLELYKNFTIIITLKNSSSLKQRKLNYYTYILNLKNS